MVVELMSANAKNIALRESPPPKAAQIMPKLPRIARNLHEPAGWLHELSQIYRCARRQHLSTDDASRLAFICSSAGKLAKDTQYLKYVASLEERLKAMGLQSAIQHFDDYSADPALTDGNS